MIWFTPDRSGLSYKGRAAAASGSDQGIDYPQRETGSAQITTTPRRPESIAASHKGGANENSSVRSNTVFSALKKAFGLNSEKDSEAASALIAEPVNHRLQGQAKMHEKFPQVRSLAVNLMISPPDYETEPTLNGRSFGPDSLAYFEFRCKNVECSGGGFDITETIGDSIAKGERSINGRRICHGTHGPSPRAHNEIRCNYELNFRVNINYVEN